MKKLLLSILLLTGLVAVAMTPEALKSYKNFEKKALQGDREAQYRLGLILETGYDTIQPDTARAVELFKKSADEGYAPAQNYLGYLYQKGQGVPQNMDSTLYWLRMAADAGDPKAAYNVAYLMLDTRDKIQETSDGGQQKNDSVAANYLKTAANAGLPTAVTMLADLYQTGRGVPCDTLRAIQLYDQAISQGWNDAELRLLNFMGPVWKQLAADDPEEALQEGAYYYRLGAPTAGVEIIKGITDHVKDLLADEKPVSEDLVYTYADACAILGEAYSLGSGVEYDYGRGLGYYYMAAMLGNPGAQFVLSEILEMFPDALSGIGGDKDAPTAYELRGAAAASGITDAEAAAFLIRNPVE